MAMYKVNEHDKRLLRLLASNYNVKPSEEDNTWYITYNNEKLQPSFSFESFDDAVNYIFDRGLIEEK